MILRLFPLILALFSLSACIGISTDRPICKKGQLTDVKDFPGPMKSAEKDGDYKAIVEKLERGIYLVREQNVPRNRDPDLTYSTLRFCRIGDQIVSEYQNYNANKKAFVGGTYWPSLVEVKGGQLHFFLLGTTSEKLDAHGIDYYPFATATIKSEKGFLVDNANSEIDKKLLKASEKLEKTPNTVIDLHKRYIFSPLVL